MEWSLTLRVSAFALALTMASWVAATVASAGPWKRAAGACLLALAGLAGLQLFAPMRRHHWLALFAMVAGSACVGCYTFVEGETSLIHLVAACTIALSLQPMLDTMCVRDGVKSMHVARAVMIWPLCLQALLFALVPGVAMEGAVEGTLALVGMGAGLGLWTALLILFRPPRAMRLILAALLPLPAALAVSGVAVTEEALLGFSSDSLVIPVLLVVVAACAAFAQSGARLLEEAGAGSGGLRRFLSHYGTVGVLAVGIVLVLGAI